MTLERPPPAGAWRRRAPSPALLAAPAALAFVASAATSAFADNQNPNVVPLGENESFLGNTGIGRPNDTGAVYYNPAGLAEIAATSVSLSGTVYASVSEHFDSIAVVNGANVPFDASGFNAIPTAFAGTIKLGDWIGSYSVLVPLSLQFGDHATLPVPGATTNYVFSSSETEVWYGLSIARKLGPGFALGVSVFGIQHGETSITGVDLFSSTGTGVFGTSISRESLQIFGILAIAGATVIASDAVRFGLRVQTAMAQVYGKGESYIVTRAVDTNGVPNASGEDVSGPANYAIPFDLGFGAAVNPAPWITLLGDVSLQLPASYQEFPASMNNQAVTLKATPRLNVGVEAHPSPAVPIRAGFYYDPSAVSGNPGNPNYESADYFGFTAGVGINREQVHTSVGAFYLWANGRRTSTAPDSAGFRVTGLGAMLTTAYVF